MNTKAFLSTITLGLCLTCIGTSVYASGYSTGVYLTNNSQDQTIKLTCNNFTQSAGESSQLQNSYATYALSSYSNQCLIYVISNKNEQVKIGSIDFIISKDLKSAKVTSASVTNTNYSLSLPKISKKKIPVVNVQLN